MKVTGLRSGTSMRIQRPRIFEQVPFGTSFAPSIKDHWHVSCPLWAVSITFCTQNHVVQTSNGLPGQTGPQLIRSIHLSNVQSYNIKAQQVMLRVHSTHCLVQWPSQHNRTGRSSSNSRIHDMPMLCKWALCSILLSLRPCRAGSFSS